MAGGREEQICKQAQTFLHEYVGQNTETLNGSITTYLTIVFDFFPFNY